VEWNTRKANPAKKSLELRRPATGRRVNPVQSMKGRMMDGFGLDELTLEEIGNILQLWNLVWPISAILLQQRENLNEGNIILIFIKRGVLCD
jgi:hypothetical protein